MEMEMEMEMEKEKEKEKEEEKEKENEEKVEEVFHISHIHFLIFKGIISHGWCGACNEPISETPTYQCKFYPKCAFQLHKSCTQVPFDLQHPLHSQHPLSLECEHPFHKLFVCDGCKDICSGMVYHCELCLFSLDVKCATATSKTNIRQTKPSKEKDAEIKKHFSHEHRLFFCNCKEELRIICNGCELPLSGAAYCCPSCSYFLHQSCFEMPREVKCFYHPQHDLYGLVPLEYCYCKACQWQIKRVNYTCYGCKLHFHIQCSKTLTPPLRHKIHEHSLFYFEAKYINGTFQCNACRRVCDGSFYRCLECNFNRHLECIPIPTTVKHKYHSHPLMLIDSFVEDDSGEYYCDACENERNPNHHVYYCQKCTYVIHIECLLSEERKELEASTSRLPSGSTAEGKEIEDEPGTTAPDSDREDRTKGKETQAVDWSIAKIDEAIENYRVEIMELVEKLKPLVAQVEALQKLRATMLNPE